MNSEYIPKIGIEVHVELKTKSKIYCSCPTDFGAKPNTQCCPVCMGMPGALPALNSKVADFAVTAGLALSCEINTVSFADRKNYFYPDLPKGYQISQNDVPLCENGYISVDGDSGDKKIRVKRIHIEEDAGKLIHGSDGTYIDFNRCGVPLIEIVSQPDISSAAEAVSYLKKLRSIMLYTGISDCRMNEGSLRCDVNVSVSKKNESNNGRRTEIKNLNSFKSVYAAIEYEIKRQTDLTEKGIEIKSETLRFDVDKGVTVPMRAKESSDEYMYFPEPDLPPVRISEERIRSLKQSLPILPDARKKLICEKYGLTEYDGELLTQSREIADYFELSAKSTSHPLTLARLITGEIFSEMTAYDTEIPIKPEHLAKLSELLREKKISGGTAKKLIKELLQNDFEPEGAVKERNLFQINDEAEITALTLAALRKNEKSVEAYKKGKETALKAIVGAVMALSGGRANPEAVNRIVKREADKLTQ